MGLFVSSRSPHKLSISTSDKPASYTIPSLTVSLVLIRHSPNIDLIPTTSRHHVTSLTTQSQAGTGSEDACACAACLPTTATTNRHRVQINQIWLVRSSGEPHNDRYTAPPPRLRQSRI